MKRNTKIIALFCLLAAIFCGTGANAAGTEKTAASAAAVYKNEFVVKNGAIYFYNANGHMVRSKWRTIRGKRYYFTRTGAAAIGWQTIDGHLYHFNKKGVMLQAGWITKHGKTYYFSKRTGIAFTGWRTIGGKKYYFGADGVLVQNHWINNRYVDKNGVYRPNKKRKLASLETSLKNILRSRSGTWQVYVEDLGTGEYFSINNQQMYAASLIKLYALGAAYDRIEHGALSESSISGTLSNMITISDNYAFNDVVRRIGITRVNTWCRENSYTGTNQGSDLEPSGNSAGLLNGSGRNVTTARDCGKFLASVYHGTCVSKNASAKMLNLLKRQERRWKIPAGVPSGVTVANKTGETNDYTHDTAIVFSPKAKYVLVVMGYVPGAGVFSTGCIPDISRTVYQYFN